MKYIYLIFFSLALAASAYAAKPTVLEQAKNTAKQTVSTNLNEAIVDILRGVKGAGGEIYAASKSAITKSIDFTMEQAPLVVKEFLHWKMAEAIIWMVSVIISAIVAFYFAHRIHKWALEYDEDLIMVSWFIRAIACATIIAAIGTNGMTITKIAVAPRVYLIEYVVDSIHGNHR